MSQYIVNKLEAWKAEKWYELGPGEAIDEVKAMSRYSGPDHDETRFPLYAYAEFMSNEGTSVSHGLGTIAIHQYPGSNRHSYYVFLGVTPAVLPGTIDECLRHVDTDIGTRLYTPNRGLANILLRRVGVCYYAESTEE